VSTRRERCHDNSTEPSKAIYCTDMTLTLVTGDDQRGKRGVLNG
jgi:hypothetical protein